MAIPRDFEYIDEADFIDHLLTPLLQRLGFTMISRYHGTREFGKDLVFGEIDRFGLIRYHGLQAKYLPSLGLSDSQSIIEDCQQAFGNPFRHPNTGQEERITCFYAVNGGTISDAARENIFNTLQSPFEGNVALLDGQQIVSLQRWATFNRQELVGEKLAGIVLELRYNRHLFRVLRERFGAFMNGTAATHPGGFRLRINACSAYLQAPILPTRCTNERVEYYWHDAGIVNSALDSISLRPQRREDSKQKMKEVLAWEHELEKSALSIEEELTDLLTTLGNSSCIRSAIEPRHSAGRDA